MVIGVVASVGWTTERWPRFLSQGVHRNLSLFCVGFVALHVVTTVSDGYVPIGFADAFLPFLTPYRPLWVGLGALGFDLLLVVLVTSALRHRIGYDSWRFVHWLAYLCWPIAMFHSLGSGSDSSLPVRPRPGRGLRCGRPGRGRLEGGHRPHVRCRPPGVAAAVGAVVVVFAIAVFAAVGPLRPGWSHRPGPRSALLAQLARKNAVPAAGTSGANRSGTAVPTAPFTYDLAGSQTTSAPDAQGQVQAHPHHAAAGPLVHSAGRGPRRGRRPGRGHRHDLRLGDLRSVPGDGHLAGRRDRRWPPCRPPARRP